MRHPLRHLSLRLRLGLAGALAVVLALGLAALGLSLLFGTHVERRAQAELSIQLDQVLAGLARKDGVLTLVREPADPRFGQPYGGLYWQIVDGDRILRSRSLWDYRLPQVDDLGDGLSHSHRLPGPDGGPLLVVERQVTLPPSLGGDRIQASVAVEAGSLAAARQDFLADMLPYLALLALVLIVAGGAQVMVGLRPLHDLGARVTALRQGTARRMGQDWPQEVRPLATEIDALISAREEDIDRARARAGDLAHGMKTPLQALMGEAGRLRRAGEAQSAAGIETIARALQRHVDRELARTRAAARARDARADVAQVVRGVTAVLRRTPEGSGLDWQNSTTPGLIAAMEESDLAEAFGALAENAARHASARVQIAAAIAEDGLIHLSLTDDGPGIAEGQLSALIARGARLDQGGSGLGLAIASDLAEASGGGLHLENTGAGLRAALRLPPAPPGHPDDPPPA